LQLQLRQGISNNSICGYRFHSISRSFSTRKDKNHGKLEDKSRNKKTLPFILINSDVVFPGQNIKIGIFNEPRYLSLMDQLLKEKGAKFGIVWNSSKTIQEVPANIGTVVKIIKSTPSEDGVNMQVCGMSRFKVDAPKKNLLGFWEQENLKLLRDKTESIKYLSLEKHFMRVIKDRITQSELSDLQKKGVFPKADSLSSPSTLSKLTFWLSSIIQDEKYNVVTKYKMLSTSTATKRMNMLFPFISGKKKENVKIQD